MTVYRTRSKDETVNTPITYRKVYYDILGNQFPTSFAPLVSSFEGTKKTMMDEPHAHFKKRKASGELVFGDMVITETTRSYVPTNIGWWDLPSRTAWYYDGDFASAAETLGGPLLISEVDMGRLGEVALVKAYANAHQPKVLGGELVSDINATLSMLRRPFSGAQDLLKRMHKFRLKRKGKTAVMALKASKDAWLEYRYGWKPLLLDADATMHAVAERILSERKQRLVARCSEQLATTRSSQFTMAPLWDPAVWQGSGTVATNSQVVAHAGVIYDVDMSTGISLTNADFGTRPSDLPSTVWEIIPYSFVLDWFVNVGDWIQAVTPVPGVTIQGSWITTIRKDIQNTTFSTVRRVGYPANDAHNGSSHVETRVTRRRCNTGLPNTPAMKANMLSALHSVDAMALLVEPLLTSLKRLKH